MFVLVSTSCPSFLHLHWVLLSWGEVLEKSQCTGAEKTLTVLCVIKDLKVYIIQGHWCEVHCGVISRPYKCCMSCLRNICGALSLWTWISLEEKPDCTRPTKVFGQLMSKNKFLTLWNSGYCFLCYWHPSTLLLKPSFVNSEVQLSLNTSTVRHRSEHTSGKRSWLKARKKICLEQ